MNTEATARRSQPAWGEPPVLDRMRPIVICGGLPREVVMAKAAHKILKHEGLSAVLDGLWLVRGSLPFPLMRYMVIYRLPDGTLLIHSAVAMHDEGMAQLEALGRPSVLVVPHGAHRMDAPFYKARYPHIRVVCPESVRAKVEEVLVVEGTCEETLPPLGIRIHQVPGFKHGELAYEVDVPGGKALILCDAVANSDYAPTFGGRMMGAITGGVGRRRLGVPRIMRFMMVKNRAVARAGIADLANVPNLKAIVLAHGRPILEGAAAALREAAETL